MSGNTSDSENNYTDDKKQEQKQTTEVEEKSLEIHEAESSVTPTGKQNFQKDKKTHYEKKTKHVKKEAPSTSPVKGAVTRIESGSTSPVVEAPSTTVSTQKSHVEVTTNTTATVPQNVEKPVNFQKKTLDLAPSLEAMEARRAALVQEALNLQEQERSMRVAQQQIHQSNAEVAEVAHAVEHQVHDEVARIDEELARAYAKVDDDFQITINNLASVKELEKVNAQKAAAAKKEQLRHRGKSVVQQAVNKLNNQTQAVASQINKMPAVPVASVALPVAEVGAATVPVTLPAKTGTAEKVTIDTKVVQETTDASGKTHHEETKSSSTVEDSTTADGVTTTTILKEAPSTGNVGVLETSSASSTDGKSSNKDSKSAEKEPGCARRCWERVICKRKPFTCRLPSEDEEDDDTVVETEEKEVTKKVVETKEVKESTSKKANGTGNTSLPAKKQ